MEINKEKDAIARYIPYQDSTESSIQSSKAYVSSHFKDFRKGWLLFLPTANSRLLHLSFYKLERSLNNWYCESRSSPGDELFRRFVQIERLKSLSFKWYKSKLPLATFWLFLLRQTKQSSFPPAPKLGAIDLFPVPEVLHFWLSLSSSENYSCRDVGMLVPEF